MQSTLAYPAPSPTGLSCTTRGPDKRGLAIFLLEISDFRYVFIHTFLGYPQSIKNFLCNCSLLGPFSRLRRNFGAGWREACGPEASPTSNSRCSGSMSWGINWFELRDGVPARRYHGGMPIPLSTVRFPVQPESVHFSRDWGQTPQEFYRKCPVGLISRPLSLPSFIGSYVRRTCRMRSPAWAIETCGNFRLKSALSVQNFCMIVISV